MTSALVHVLRGKLLESIHYGHIAVVDKRGRAVATVGNEKMVTYWRSAAKPFQAMAVIMSGAADRYNLSEQELAVMTSSHSGELMHTDTVKGILEKLALEENALLCGIHPPYHQRTRKLLFRSGGEPESIHNNCSGKHAGILAICRQNNWDLHNYNDPDHPVQRLFLDIVAEVTEFPREEIHLGIDGCGVVVFALPLERMAYAYARLANPETLPAKYREAAEQVSASMEAYPQMVAGSERFNSELLEVTGNKLVAKTGAEGLFCLGVHEGIGLALKISDGNSRALPPASIEALSQLGILSKTELAKLTKYHAPEVLNAHRNRVGRLAAAFKLNWPSPVI